MRGLLSILSLFRNKFNKFNNTGARILDSIHCMTLKLLNNHSFGVKTSRFCHLFCNVIMDVITLWFQISKPLVVYIQILLHGIKSLPDMTSCDKMV